jgi:hypothetical protein
VLDQKLKAQLEVHEHPLRSAPLHALSVRGPSTLIGDALLAFSDAMIG